MTLGFSIPLFICFLTHPLNPRNRWLAGPHPPFKSLLFNLILGHCLSWSYFFRRCGLPISVVDSMGATRSCTHRVCLSHQSSQLLRNFLFGWIHLSRVKHLTPSLGLVTWLAFEYRCVLQLNVKLFSLWASHCLELLRVCEYRVTPTPV